MPEVQQDVRYLQSVLLFGVPVQRVSKVKSGSGDFKEGRARELCIISRVRELLRGKSKGFVHSCCETSAAEQRAVPNMNLRVEKKGAQNSPSGQPARLIIHPDHGQRSHQGPPRSEKPSDLNGTVNTVGYAAICASCFCQELQ